MHAMDASELKGQVRSHPGGFARVQLRLVGMSRFFGVKNFVENLWRSQKRLQIIQRETETSGPAAHRISFYKWSLPETLAPTPVPVESHGSGEPDPVKRSTLKNNTMLPAVLLPAVQHNL
ncbi:unnamed protein product [Pleuronectes platessa]|uniref:Uncharacterized protein n=1 Tax=Pleuronectes platessa TaxID=8262 RepID=A0A9N7V1U1_PLEPL|nr:unnamed protein product [Pleuronectes platessa]